MTPKSFSVRLYLQDGHADGVKILSRSKWSGRGLVIPRRFLERELDRKELNAPGVYLLVAPNQDGDCPPVTVGAGTPVCDVLRESGPGLDFWNQAMVFASKEDALTAEDVLRVAALLQERALRVGKSRLVASGVIVSVDASSDEESLALDFCEQILSVLPLLGVAFFEESS